MSDRGFTWTLAIVVIVVVLFGVFYTGKSVLDCDAKGGVLVRGTFGYACVAAP